MAGATDLALIFHFPHAAVKLLVDVKYGMANMQGN
jgi:hypothetical protein